MALSAASRRLRASRGGAGLAQRDFLLLLAATVGVFSNYAPLLSVAPLWSAEGGSGNTGVGAVTGVTMATTVGVQLCMPWLLRRLSLRRTQLCGALLLGLPTFGYPLSAASGWVLTLSGLRGVGFGMVAVAGSALVAELVPPGSRGRAVGWYGVAVGLPQVVCLPLGVWVAENVGFTAVFVAAGALSVLAAPLAAAIRVPQRHDDPRRRRPRSPVASDAGRPRSRVFAAPFAVLIASACALGGLTSFLPVALGPSSVAPLALFLLSAGVIVGRWAAGVLSDRAGMGHLVFPGVLACAVGMGGFGLTAGPFDGATAPVAAAAVVYGLGFGVLQNETLVVMFRRAGRNGAGRASTLWNMAYDAGAGIGSVAVGLVSHALGLDGSFLAAAALILLVAPLALGAGRSRKPGSPG